MTKTSSGLAIIPVVLAVLSLTVIFPSSCVSGGDSAEPDEWVDYGTVGDNPPPPALPSKDDYIDTVYEEGDFRIADNGVVSGIFVHPDDDWGVIRAASDLKADIGKVTGKTPRLLKKPGESGGHAIIIGTIGRSPVIDGLIESGKLEAEDIRDGWESFVIQVVDDPLPWVQKGLVIAGSDRRGTIYGIYDLSSRIGVSPWHYWADVPPKEKKTIAVKPGRWKQGEPSIRYRGIFLNDEAPCLSGWVDGTFGDFTHEFYEKVFELLLRLKANYLWPAMWDNAFSDDDPLNPRLADRYGIVMGTSHHEPMMRAHKEWKKYGSGEWNYAENGKALRDFWDAGMKRNGDYENIVTVGMRGDGDEPMPGNSLGEKIGLLEQIITDQRRIIASRVDPDVTLVPQVWAIYKEVQDFYDAGMEVPDDITLLWCDDNFGNVRRLPTPEERKRKGGAGVYYHFDYVGGPRSYKWINTVPITKIWEQMHMAYEYGARRIWIVNAGDLKPMEFPISFFLDLAWNAKRWDGETVWHFAVEWAEEQFGSGYARDIADILLKYTKYNGRIKPEIVSETTYSLLNYREAERVVSEWKEIVRKAETIYGGLPASYRDAFFQLVLYPARASMRVTEMHYYAAVNRLYYKQERSLANLYAGLTQKTYDDEATDTFYYNRLMADGKWNRMMDQPHIGSTSWDGPKVDKMPEVYKNAPQKEAAMGVAVEGSAAAWPGSEEPCALPAFSRYADETYRIDVFNRGSTPFPFTAVPKQPWIAVSVREGIVVTEQRLLVDIVWEKAPRGKAIRGTIVITGPDGVKVDVRVSAFNPRSPKKNHITGFAESSGYVSIEAEHYTQKTDTEGASWKRIYDYGRTGSSMAIVPVTAPGVTEADDAPRLEYDLWIFNPGEVTVTTYTAPSLNVDPSRGLRYAVSFDDDEPVIVDTFRPDQDGYYTDKEWSRAVLDNVCLEETVHTIRSAGNHTLKIRMVDPGIVLQKIVIDTGGVKESYLGPPESPPGAGYAGKESGIPPADPAVLPGTIEAEHYNDGAAGTAWFDTTPGNAGAVYRKDDVDIFKAGSGNLVVELDAGEWLTYDIYAECGTGFRAEITASSEAAAGAVCHIDCDGEDISGPVTIATAGSPDGYAAVTVPLLVIDQGIHRLGLVVDEGKARIDRISLSTSNGNVWIEAEQAAGQPLFNPFYVQSDPTASREAYIVVPSETVTSPPKKGIASYTFRASGDVNVWMRLHAPDSNSDSLYVRIDDSGWQTWNSIEGASLKQTWVFFRKIFGLEDGLHTIRIARREAGVKLDKILVTPNLDFVPGRIPVEAESAAGGPAFSPFRVAVDPDVSGGNYIAMKAKDVTNPPEKGIASFPFDAEGSVNVWLNLHMPDANESSFFIRIDDGYWQVLENLETAKGEWTWVRWRRLDNLSQKTHTLQVAGRNGEVKLDEILVTDDLAFIPGNFANKPVPVPGRIEAEDYNKGLNGIAYYDTTAGNECEVYRNDDVDICTGNDSYVVGYTANREWLTYEVEVEPAVSYTVEIGASNGTENPRTCHLECDNADIIRPGGVSIPSTGDWDTYVPVTVTGVSIPAGRHTLRLFIDMSYINIDYLLFTKEGE
ncbi:MAG: glycosyl hydrolase 115 family protein [Spirochaetales bacterium]|nr:glycosyl hydrolase 115 family protein [Spirochaetales bacterium]